MKRLLNYFLRGLVVSAPLALTLYVCWIVFVTIDRWIGFQTPGLGFAVTIVVITLVGFLASNLLTRSLVSLVERIMNRLPFVRLLYASSRDLLNAFVGEHRRFDKPVLVALFPGSGAKALGFVTAQSLAQFELADHVAVYFPQSYNFAGNLVICPSGDVQPVSVESSAVMAFIVSGGVTGVTGSGKREAGSASRRA